MNQVQSLTDVSLLIYLHVRGSPFDYIVIVAIIVHLFTVISMHTHGPPDPDMPVVATLHVLQTRKTVLMRPLQSKVNALNPRHRPSAFAL